MELVGGESERERGQILTLDRLGTRTRRGSALLFRIIGTFAFQVHPGWACRGPGRARPPRGRRPGSPGAGGRLRC